MNVVVQGLWHLGCVTAACLAELGHQVTGLDAELGALPQGKAPLHEPGLDALIQAGLAAKTLSFSSDLGVLGQAEVLWVCFDTPVDENDKADVDFVLNKVRASAAKLAPGAVVLISSQLPAGSTRALAAEFPALRFAYSPENLRLGKALEVFRQPDRIVVGVDSPEAKAVLERLLAPLKARIEWMSVPAAEMTKHAINAFLALSVVFINELGVLCEKVGADVKDVERGLKSEQRIGPKAYLGAGAAFAGGTLARDLAFLKVKAEAAGLESGLFDAAIQSNRAHMRWPLRKLSELLGRLEGKRIGVLGLAYKNGTDTLRRSQAVELAQALLGQGAKVQAFDPLIKALPAELGAITLVAAPQDLKDCDAVVVCLNWDGLGEALKGGSAAIVDPAGALSQVAWPQGTLYHRVGFSSVQA